MVGSCILWGASTDISTNIPVDTSVDTRSRLRRVSADSPLNDIHGVGRRIGRDTVGGISANHRSYIGQLSVKFRSIICRYSTDVATHTLASHAESRNGC